MTYAPCPVNVGVCVRVCVICPAVQVYMQAASVCPVRDTLITKQDVKHFSADLVLVIAPTAGLLMH